jgi:hypothetical protein
VVEQLVGVFARNEQIEAVLSAHANLKGGLSYQFSAADANFTEWKTMFEQSSRNIESVCGLLDDYKRASVSINAVASWPKPVRQLPVAESCG